MGLGKVVGVRGVRVKVVGVRGDQGELYVGVRGVRVKDMWGKTTDLS